MSNTQTINQKALNPPRGECRQCWLHAYASRQAHAHLGWREDCPDCVDHMKNGHPADMIVV
ncbi:pRL2-8 [Kitasatospora sp. NPDC001261]|uniref:pRL2-8 n=1 Tax=Kitasatospora sp. NPDC001261 TaxID=3364012 RepID=UPI0036B80332